MDFLRINEQMEGKVHRSAVDLTIIQGLAAMTLAVSSLVAAVGCKEAAADREKPAEIQTQKPSVFRKAEKLKQIDRNTIPASLAVRIKGQGTVEIAPEKYDPSLPNLYLIGVTHTRGDNQAKGLDSQKQALEIFHTLYSLGTERQIMEGVDRSKELIHDRPQPGFNETPYEAMPVYLRTGKIHRGYVAVEGIYGSSVESLGAEDEKLELTFRKNPVLTESNELKITGDILARLCDEFKVPVEKSKLAKRDYRRSIAAQIWKDHVSCLPADKIQGLINRTVLANQEYQEFNKTMAASRFHTYQGRNKTFRDTLKSIPTKDTAFIVGAAHMSGIAGLVKNYNVFGIKTDAVNSQKLHYYHEKFSLQEYQNDLLKYDLYLYGLGEKPEKTLFDDI